VQDRFAGPGPGDSGGTLARRFRARLLEPINLATPLVALVFCVGRPWGLIADIPYWVILGVLLGAQLLNALGKALWSDATSGSRLWARVGIEMAVIGIVVYAVGWGSMLAVGFVFGAADAMRTAGYRAVKPAMFASVVVIGLGQLAVSTGIAPSLVPMDLVHGLGLLAALGALLTILLIGWFAHAREVTEGRFEALVRHASDLIVVVTPTGLLSYVSPSFHRTLGPPEAASEGSPAAELVHPDDLRALRALTGDVRASGDRGFRSEVRLRAVDGSWRWFDATVTDAVSDPNVGGIIGNLHDITDRKAAEVELLEAHERFHSAFESAPIGMGIVDLDGAIVQANPAFGRIVGRMPDELVGMSISELTHPDDRELSAAEMQRLLEGECEGYQIEKRYLHSLGHVVWCSVNISCVRDRDGRPRHFLGQVEDVTERRTLRERLAYAAIHDALTGLPNRTLFLDRLEVALNRSNRDGSRVAVVFLDLDHFKLVNDSFGHAAGDRLLVTVADRLRSTLRSSDTVARFGGDEFTILGDGVTDEQDALELAQRLADAVTPAVPLPEGEIYVTASVGVSLSGCATDSPASLLRDADTAMYRAKDRGRACIEVFDEHSHETAVATMRTTNELHTALERDELRVFYQPIVDLRTGRLAGLEALLRWQHPDRGLLHPGEFLEFAEQAGLIVPIGAWVLEESCGQLACWERERATRGLRPLPIGLSVNLSPRQLTSPSLVDEVAATIAASGLSPATVWLEITEGALVGDADSTLEVLHRLRAVGVRLSIDDFGAGYSSLGYLRSFPVEALKIDRSFVEGLGRESSDATIVQSVLALTRSLGLVAIAEGAERPNQIRELRTLGCDYAQGFGLGIPLPADVIGSVLADDLDPWSVDREDLVALLHPA
jgi:diguanylate cyclase (GGDEF)-like protein/PAS domain S-box-containing protein